MQISYFLLPILVLAGTLLGEPLSASLHDSTATLGGARGLPGAVIRTADPEAARRAALAAGAAEVWMALPSGDARLAGASPDPGTLREGSDGRIRYDGARRLPLPEGLGGLIRLHSDQLGPGTPPSLLADRAVVVVWDDPALGRREAAPGRVEPVDRGELLAVALAAGRAEAHVYALPLGAAAGLVAVVALLWQLVLDRLTTRRAFVASGAGFVAVFAWAVALRSVGVDLPWVGLGATFALAFAARLLRQHHAVLVTLDRIVLRLGAQGGEPDLPGLSTARDPQLAEAEAAVARALARRADSSTDEGATAPASA